ncbi:uncharacterized protein E0L32_006202 [Thyridium curvatum]|uniref:Uncharacterized protein n=1 Tax=Thyridium curvatum TaxID=1093900 RepID=A0A507AU10_9PEZI|nr:uncharacterized protein E0L32_006202 [Thyridium curvatum]TPX13472.1 hypothetical protein E0L32_006202 [Thyridium curvatum]
MFSKRAVYTEKGPAPLAGIYNQAIIAKDMVYCSGVIATDPATDDLVEGDIKVHTVGETGFSILAAGADAAGTDIDNVVKVTVYLSNMEEFDAMNSVYSQYWGNVKPCRT